MYEEEYNVDLEKENNEQKNNDEKIFEKDVCEYSEGYEDKIQIPKELRKIRTQAYDKSVEDTVRMIEKGRIFLQPDFQRYSQVWDYKTASQLIESVLLNVPIPPIYVAEEDDGSWNIIDGLQRLTSFKNFYEGKFKLRGLDSLKELNKQGIPTIVWLTPILPFINDTKENIVAILKGCFEAGVKGVICFGMGVTLREGSRDYYYQQLDQLFPGMKEKYQSTYNDQYTLNSPHNRELMNLFFEKCQQYHMMCNYPEIFAYLQEFETKIEVKEKESQSFEQLSLF